MKKKIVFKVIFIFFTFSLFFVFKNIFSSEIILNDTLPLEYQYIIRELENDPIYKKDNDLIKKAKKLNDIFSKLSDDQLFFLIKTTIYKKILNFSSSLSNDPPSETNDFLIKLRQKEKLLFETSSPFYNWLFSALLTDVEKTFKEGMVFQKDKKIVFPLANLFLLKTPEELKEIFRPLLVDIHQTIELQSLLYISLTQQNIPLLTFKPFTFKEEEMEEQTKRTSMPEIPSPKMTALPLSPEGDWKPQR